MVFWNGGTMNDDEGITLTIENVVENELPTANEPTNEASYSEVFRNVDFMKLLTGQFFSNFGDAIFRISIQFYVYYLTGSATAMTLILAVQTIPWVIIGPIAGVFADRVSRKAIMIGADIIRGFSILMLPLLPFIFNEATIIYGVAVIAFILGAASATFVAPRSAAVPEITGLRLYVKAISLSQLIFQTLSVIGPLIAAPIYLALHEQTFWITSACYFFSAIIIFLTKIPSAIRDVKEKIGLRLVLRDLKNGFSFLLRHPTVRLVIILFTFIVIGTAFAGPLLLPYLFEIKHNAISIQYFTTPKSIFSAKNLAHILQQYYNTTLYTQFQYFNIPGIDQYIRDPSYIAAHYYDAFIPKYTLSIRTGLRSLSESQYAYIGASSALGAVTGNLTFGRFEKKIGRSRALLFGSIAISGYYFVFFFKPGLVVLLFLGLALGFFNGMMSLSVNGLFAENVPNKVRGRAYSATNAYIQILSVSCLAVSGLTADSIGLVMTITGSGIFLLITTVIMTLWTKVYRFADEKPNPELVAYK
ncbi:MFS transporter [Candidatus Heimdallarchaeota archaeon]|nr:MAG: MFS transporter [Candidatus Heimdallarchaeota archaeon]